MANSFVFGVCNLIQLKDSLPELKSKLTVVSKLGTSYLMIILYYFNNYIYNYILPISVNVWSIPCETIAQMVMKHDNKPSCVTKSAV